MSEVSEPAFDSDGRVVCPAHIDRDVDSLRIEFGKARVEQAAALHELKGIVTNGLQSDVTNIKQNMATKADIDAVKEIAQAWKTGRTVWRLIHDIAAAVVKIAAVAGVVGGVAGGLGRLWGVL